MKYLLLLLLSGYLPTSSAQDMLGVCIDYHCENRQDITISHDEWQHILQPFQQQARSAAQERQQIRQAIGLFEKIVGSHTPTSNDLPGNKGEDKTGQLDCIAESTNTRHYLQWLEKKDKLKWHRVNERVQRSPLFFDVHWGVKITDQSSRQAYVVDSWYGANGDMPDIQPLSQWLDKKL